MKRVVLFVEGDGESAALPRLIKRLLAEQNAFDVLFLDENTFRVGEINKLVKNGYHEWKRKLAASLKRKNVGGVLLVLDGDAKSKGDERFCAAKSAKDLASEAKSNGAGSIFSVAVVLARQEYESWLIAGFESLAGKNLPDGRRISVKSKIPDGNLEESPRNAKGWFSKVIEGGYKPTRDQSPLTDLVDLNAIRARNMRSFKRLESALSQLTAAIRDGKHVATPS